MPRSRRVTSSVCYLIWPWEVRTDSSYFVLLLIRPFSIRRILHAYSGTKRCSHCAQACHRRLCPVRGVRSLATDPRCNGGRGKAVVLIPRTRNPNPRRYFYGRMLSPGAVFLPCSNGC